VEICVIVCVSALVSSVGSWALPSFVTEARGCRELLKFPVWVCASVSVAMEAWSWEASSVLPEAFAWASCALRASIEVWSWALAFAAVELTDSICAFLSLICVLILVTTAVQLPLNVETAWLISCNCVMSCCIPVISCCAGCWISCFSSEESVVTSVSSVWPEEIIESTWFKRGCILFSASASCPVASESFVDAALISSSLEPFPSSTEFNCVMADFTWVSPSPSSDNCAAPSESCCSPLI